MECRKRSKRLRSMGRRTASVNEYGHESGEGSSEERRGRSNQMQGVWELGSSVLFTVHPTETLSSSNPTFRRFISPNIWITNMNILSAPNPPDYLSNTSHYPIEKGQSECYGLRKVIVYKSIRVQHLESGCQFQHIFNQPHH